MINPAGHPVPGTNRLSTETSSSLTAATSALTIALEGQRGITVAIEDQTAITAVLGLRYLNSKGTYETRYFFDGNKLGGVANLPNGTGATEPGVTFSGFALPGDTHAAVYVASYTSGTANVKLTASDDVHPIFTQAAFGIDGGNPSGTTSESPGSYSIGGKDPATTRIHRTAAYDSGGRAITREWGPGTWSAFSALNGATAPSAQRAAGGTGVRHVCTSIVGTLSVGTIAAAAASPAVALVLLDGAATTLWAAQMSCTAAVGSHQNLCISGLNLRGSSNTVMTLLFATASGLSIQQAVTMTGSSVTE